MQLSTFWVQPPMRFRFGFAENVVFFLTAGRDCLTAGRPSDGDLLSRFFRFFTDKTDRNERYRLYSPGVTTFARGAGHQRLFWVQPPLRFRFDFAKKSCQLGLSGGKVWTIRGKLCGEILHWNVFFLHVHARAASRRVGERRSFPQGPPRIVPTFLEALILVLEPPPAPRVRVGARKSANSRPRLRRFCLPLHEALDPAGP